MRIIGIDPGSLITGFGVIDVEGVSEQYVTSGTICLRAQALSERLEVLYDDLQVIFTQHRPDQVVVEGLFSNINWRSSLVMGHARGVILLVAQQHGCGLTELQPRTVKKCIAGTGSASKQLVAAMVGRRLGLTHALRVDASDALALALSYRANKLVASASSV